MRFDTSAVVACIVVGMLNPPAFAQWGGNRGGGGGNRASDQQIGEAIVGGLILGAAINQAMQPPRRPSYPSYQNYQNQNYQNQNYQNYQNSSRPQYYPSRPQPQYIYESQPRIEYSQPTERIISSQPVERVISSSSISGETIISSRPVERVISSSSSNSGETIISSKPVETVVATPKPNVVKDTPKANTGLKASLDATLGLNGGAGVDPLLAVAAQEAAGQVTDAVGQFVDSKGSDEMKADWQKVCDGGFAPDAIEAFWKKHGAAVDDADVKALGPTHVALAKIVQDLRDGLLSGAGKKASLEKIAGLVADLPAGHPLRADLVGGLARLRQFQKLGDLVELAAAAPMPLVPIMHGATAMGLPVSVVAEVIELPLMQNPVGDSEPLPSDVTIRIVNPSTTQQAVNCAIAGRQVEMLPGWTEELKSSTSVAFDPGDGSRRSVEVTAGTWSWKLENGRWKLSKVNAEISIENPKYRSAFLYTVNGKHASVAPGATAKHSAAMPIEISFDRGNGAGSATKVLTFGTYAVGVDTSSNGLELFRTDVQLPPPPTATATATAAAATTAAPAGGDRVRKALENAEKQKALSKLLESLDQEKK